jgi:hypothetical protein
MEQSKSNENPQSAADAMTRLHNLASEHPDPEKDKIAKKLLEQWEKAQEEGNSDEVIRLIGEIDKLYDGTPEKEGEKEKTPDEHIEISGASLEEKLHIKEQYEKQKEILEKTGILQTLKSGEKGIVGIDGEEYPIPTYEEIQERVEKNKEMLALKTEQGFTELLITPFGMSFDSLREKAIDVVWEHHKSGKFFSAVKSPDGSFKRGFDSKKSPNDPDVPLDVKDKRSDLDLWKWDNYRGTDKNGMLVYEPKRFDKINHGGKTKQEILERDNSGWQVAFIEDLPLLPAKGEAKSIGPKGKERRQLAVGNSPEQYLKLLDPKTRYRGESGMTHEDWLAYVVSHLEKTNQMIDTDPSRVRWGEDGEIDGTIYSWNLGSYLPEGQEDLGDFSLVPYGYWGWGCRSRQLRSHWSESDSRFRDGGTRTKVKI